MKVNKKLTLPKFTMSDFLAPALFFIFTIGIVSSILYFINMPFRTATATHLTEASKNSCVALRLKKEIAEIVAPNSLRGPVLVRDLSAFKKTCLRDAASREQQMTIETIK